MFWCMYNTVEIEKLVRERLVEAFRQSGLTQTAIAKQANIHVSMITDYKNTSKLPSLVNFVVLCKVLDVSADDILGLREY